MSNAIGRENVAGAVAVVGTVVALVTILFGGLLEILFDATVPTVLFEVAGATLPLVGLVLVVVVLWKMRNRDNQRRQHDTFKPQDSEGTSLSTTQGRVGTEFDQRLTNAAADWYRCEETYSVSTVHSALVDSAIRVVKTSQGLTQSDAAAAIETGQWTADPVAGAFLSPTLSQPLVERLRGALDPAAAFRRRVERTLAAIEELEDKTMTTGNSAVYEDSQSSQRTDDAQPGGADDGAEEVVSS